MFCFNIATEVRWIGRPDAGSAETENSDVQAVTACSCVWTFLAVQD